MVFTPDMDFTVQNKAKIFMSICQLLKNTAFDSAPCEMAFIATQPISPRLFGGPEHVAV
jgi:hypothetical protein